MAKQKNSIPSETMEGSGGVSGAPDIGEAVVSPAVQPEMSASVCETLKLYPQYKSLYVDASGGVYTIDTPEVIRGKAKLYENPFYRS